MWCVCVQVGGKERRKYGGNKNKLCYVCIVSVTKLLWPEAGGGADCDGGDAPLTSGMSASGHRPTSPAQLDTTLIPM